MDEDLYKEIETLEDLAYDIQENKMRTEGEKNEFIKEKFNNTLRKLHSKLKLTENAQERREIIEGIDRCRKAYSMLSTPEKREKYAELRQETKDAYKLLGVLQDSLEYRSDEENDEYIKRKLEFEYKNLISKLNATHLPDERKAIDERIKRLKDNYLKINTAENRRNYDLELAYNKSEQADYGVIAEKDGKKQINYKPYMESPLYELQNESGETIKVKLKGEVHYKNYLGMEDDYINQFEVRRLINGEEKTFTIYTNSIIVADLDIDKETGELKNPEYYTTVANELLSNDTLEASTKYNGGYVGEIEDNELGIKKKKLDDTQKERLGVILSYNEMKDKSKEDDGEER